MSNRPDNGGEAEAQDTGPEPGPELSGEKPAVSPDAPSDKPPRHRLRWALLCVGASAVTATLFLLFELRLGMPLAFASTMLLAVAVAAGLPLLIVGLVGKSLRSRGLAYAGQYLLLCLLLSAIFTAAILI